MKESFHGRYVSGSLFQSKTTGQWVAEVSYAGIKRFADKKEAINWMSEYGVFDN